MSLSSSTSRRCATEAPRSVAVVSTGVSNVRTLLLTSRSSGTSAGVMPPIRSPAADPSWSEDPSKGSGRNRRSRQIDGERTARAGQVANVELAAARLNALQADREPEAEPGLIDAALLKRTEQILGRARRQPA